MGNQSGIDWDEMFEYLPGTVVELVAQPGTPYVIDYYEAVMVPPIWLVGEPMPRYADELKIISRRAIQVCDLDRQLTVA